MQVVRGYKTELDLNKEQRTACLKHAGVARFAYNWGLARSQEISRATGKRPTAVDLHKDLNKLKKTNYPWMYEVLQVCAARGTTGLRYRLQELLPPRYAQKARQVERQGRLPNIQEEKQGHRLIPLDRLRQGL
jgi:Helix-turn-helix domain